MKKILPAVMASISAPIMAGNIVETNDSISVFGLNEVVVVASAKENSQLRSLPASSTTISGNMLEQRKINEIKGLSNFVPNLYTPEYGSRLTSAISIRGIGSRINTPVIGMYVDNVPYIDKSAFDFNFYDIEKIEVLRGPQGTLYGRNTMGGLINIYTRSPFNYQGTDIKFGIGTYNNYSASVTHYHRISEKFAFSAGGFYKYSGGFFENTYLNKKADSMNNGGGRMRAIVRPNSNLDIDIAVAYERNNQGGYAYAAYDKEHDKVGEIASNEEGRYKRDMMNSSLKIGYTNDNILFNSITGYQYLKDRMFMDQDFTPRDIYTIEQKQKIHTISQEFVARSNHDKNYQWTTGVFGFYQSLNTNAPVTFRKDGIGMIHDIMDQAMGNSPVKVKLLDEEMPIHGNYDTPLMGAAVYHQSVINNLFTEGLSLTLGLRLDYEKMWITHNTSAAMTAQASMMGKPMGNPITMPVNIEGEENDDYLKLLPKIALKYDFSNNSSNIYATVSRGYRSGGYNIQMFSDIVKDKLMSKPDMGGGKPGNGMPGSKRNGATSGAKSSDSYANIKDIIRYKPEQTWNYEIGSHMNFWSNRLNIDIAAFYMQTTDQQIAMFAPSGLGRMTVNSGKSRSIGTEISASIIPVEGLHLYTSYGYTNAKFTDYSTNEKISNTTQEINYDGNYIPMTPQNTFAVGADYRIKCMEAISIFDFVNLGMNYNGVGNIYFTEKNDVKQKFYGTLNFTAGIEKNNFKLDLWFNNILDTEYKTFYFETIGQTMSDKAGFFQKGKPFHFGMNIKFSF